MQAWFKEQWVFLVHCVVDGRGCVERQLGSGRHSVFAAPMWHAGQEQRGRCRTVRHRAFSPQAPRNSHGSMHWKLMHAFSLEHSKSLLHSASKVTAKWTEKRKHRKNREREYTSHITHNACGRGQDSQGERNERGHLSETPNKRQYLQAQM